MSEFPVWVVFCDGKLDRFMHASDMFERHKRLIYSDSPERIIVTLKPRLRLTRSRFNIWTRIFREHGALAVWVPAHPGFCWRDEAVLTFSTGYIWCLARDFLLAHAWPNPWK
jgi:hypothetical protein